MIIYLSHSKNFDYNGQLYRPLKSSELAASHQFIFPHADLAEGIDAKILFAGKKCDLIIAEVSFPATGQGIELGWADYNNIPIICVYKAGQKISGSLKRISSIFIEYAGAADLISKLEPKLQ